MRAKRSSPSRERVRARAGEIAEAVEQVDALRDELEQVREMLEAERLGAGRG